MPNITPQYFGNPFAAHYYGGQLKDLLNRICDPLCQSVGITFIGDSITWGVGATGSAPETPRDGTLSDPRDYYKTGSYVNLVKRHIKSMLGNDTSEVLSNHPASSSGESIVTYTKTEKVFPSGGLFTVDLVGTATDTETMDDQTLLNARRVFSVAAGAGNTASLSFAFTGDTLEVVFGVHGTGARYNLYVDGVLIDADCGTRTGDDGMTLGYSRSRIHTFGRVVNKTVKIEVIPHEENAGASSMYLEALRIPKTIRIKNQGISGIKSTTFRTYNMPSSWDGVSPYPTDNSFGDGVALDTEDDFCFVQLGTNDRIASDAYIESPQTLYTKLAEIIDLMPHETNPILMVANPAENDEPPTYHCGMRDQANVISKLARDRNIDFIDNFTIFQGVPFYAFTADGLHPNDLGYKIMASNIIHAIENAK